MDQFTQENRFISIETPLAKDELLLTSFQGSEYISSNFEFTLGVLSSNLALNPKDLVGEQVTVTIHNEQQHTFNGYVSQFSFGEIQADNLREYRMTVVPWMWFLSQTKNQRIFQNKSVKEIVSQVFDDLGFNDYKFAVTGANKPREYCVQYGESDLNFVSRLLEEEGVAYYFKQETKKHTLMIVDQPTVYETCAEAEVTYSKGNQPDSQIKQWEHLYSFKKGGWIVNDYSFKEPAKNLIAETPTRGEYKDNDKFWHYEYPGLHDLAAGKEIATLRADAEDVPMDVIKASSDCSSFYAGGRFSLAKHDTKSENGGYLITEIHHSAVDNSYHTGSNNTASYSNNFICIPDSVHFRPELKYTKPVMKGPQSAVVTGPAGEEIYIDDLGRIKVQFIWDREGQFDESSSCYLRVVQSWAGNEWGASFIPRIGHEVIVNFLDGDPDRPLVTGSVYNGANKPPYATKTQSGIKTRSTKGASSSNYNELRFEDKKGEEQLYIQAEKDMDTLVKNNQSLTVENDRTKNVHNDESSSIGHDRIKTVGNDQSESIGNNKSIDVGSDHSESIGNNKSLDVAVNHSESVGKNMTISVGGDLKESVSGQYNENVTKEYGLKAKTITLEADSQITLKTGSAKITMKSNGDITLSGKNINVKGSGNVVIKGSKTSVN